MVLRTLVTLHNAAHLCYFRQTSKSCLAFLCKTLLQSMASCQLSKPVDGSTRLDKEMSSIIVGLI